MRKSVEGIRETSGLSSPATLRRLPSEALAAHRAELLELAAKFGLRNVRVFGSVARGQDGVKSDVDILVSRGDGVGLLSVAAFGEQASELLGVEVDVVTDGGLGPEHEIFTTAIAV